jgi:hypothetical protein
MIATHILEGKVFEMIRETMLDPVKLRLCIDSGGGLDDRSTARELPALRKISGQSRAIGGGSSTGMRRRK